MDALTIAATYRNTAGSIQALLDAGAAAQPPEGVRVRHSPLTFASMTGDLENVTLLLARGAKVSAEPLSEAVTFGYPDVVQTMIKAGGDAKIREGTGINLLHWATITNRANLIPILVKAGTPLASVQQAAEVQRLAVTSSAQCRPGWFPVVLAARQEIGVGKIRVVLLLPAGEGLQRGPPAPPAVEIGGRRIAGQAAKAQTRTPPS